MSRIPLCATVTRYLLLGVMTGSTALLAQEEEVVSDIPALTTSTDEQSFRQAITAIESGQGAYASELPEQLLSLGLTLQSQGRHSEAVKLFKRGVHLARINNGLYSQDQIPLLQGEIASHIALGEFASVDERQRYLYRVQVRSLDSGQPRAMALMQQANWQYNAFQLRLGDQGFSRLMNMWDLYVLALNDILDREGKTSANLLPPLRGMLQAQYLISAYDPQSESSSYGSADDLGARQALNRFNAYRSQSYKRGRDLILVIHDIEEQRLGEHSAATARAMLMLGDWQLWHNRREDAWQSYQAAMAELAELDGAQVQVDQWLGQPIPLPDIDGLRPLPGEVDPEKGDILLQFGVNAKGRVVDLERLGGSEEKKARGNRLMRKLRKTQFRPRFKAGERVGTDKLVKAYEIE